MEENRGRKLPPLSPRQITRQDPEGSEDPVRRKRKKKSTEEEYEEGESPRRPRRRPRSGSRPGPGDESERSEDGGGRGRAAGRKRGSTPRARTPSVGGSSRGEVGDEGEVETARTVDSGTASTGSRPQPKEPKKTTRKTKPKTIGTSRETLMHQTEDEEGSPIKKKKKKKKHTTALADDDTADGSDLGLAAELSPIRDDVVDMDETKEDISSTHWTTPVMRSEPLGTLFIEKKGGFKAADKTKLARRLHEEQQRIAQLPEAPSSETTIQFGLATHRVFKTFTLFCHGLFAGFAFWHIVMVFTMSNIVGSDGFLQYYRNLSQPVQSLYYLLFVLTCVSTFDRYDISRPNKRFLLRAFTLQNGAVACLLYFVTLIISLAIAATDDKISLYNNTAYPKLWGDKQARDSELNTWRILNLIRGLGAIFGWLVISLRPNTDRLVKNLEKADENILGDNIEIPVVQSSGI